MTTSERGLSLIKSFEGLRLRAYKCPAEVWTIGYGHTKGVKEGMIITEQQAEQFLIDDLKASEYAVGRLVKKPLLQNQFDALVSFVFNLGEGNFSRSTLLKRVNDNPHNPLIREQFMKWVFAGGKVLQGLINRRKAEADLYCGQYKAQ